MQNQVSLLQNLSLSNDKPTNVSPVLYALNRIKLPFPPDSYIPKRLEKSYMDVLPIHLEHTLRVGQLPPYHNDPFDRLLIAQAYTEHLTVITKDALFKQYKIETAW